jgi:hypothetical protein
MKNDLLFQEDFDHKIWGAVSMIMKGAYRVGQASG